MGSSNSHGSSSSDRPIGADVAMVMMVQQLGQIAATLARGHEQQAQAMARQEQALLEVVNQQKEQGNKLEKLDHKLEKLKKLDEVSSKLEKLEELEKLEKLEILDEVSSKLEKLEKLEDELGQ